MWSIWVMEPLFRWDSPTKLKVQRFAKELVSSRLTLKSVCIREWHLLNLNAPIQTTFAACTVRQTQKEILLQEAGKEFTIWKKVNFLRSGAVTIQKASAWDVQEKEWDQLTRQRKYRRFEAQERIILKWKILVDTDQPSPAKNVWINLPNSRASL